MTHARKIPIGSDEIIKTLYKRGKTLQEIGDIFGVTRERIRQKLRRFGVESCAGGRSLRSFANQSEKRKKQIDRRADRVAKMEEYFGCDYDQIIAICGVAYSDGFYSVGGPRSDRKYPGAAYVDQRKNAKQRGIDWTISLADWWRIWQESGHWEKRGRGEGYCMARYGDCGPYSVENVYICTAGQNFSDSYLVHPWSERFPDRQKADPLALSKLEQSIVDLRASGLTRSAIAERLNRPQGSINWAAHKAIKKLAARGIHA